MPVGGSVKRTPCPVNAFTIRAVNGADRAAVTSRMYSNNVKNMSKILIYIRFQCGLATTLEVIMSSVAVNGTIDTPGTVKVLGLPAIWAEKKKNVLY